MLNVNLDIAVYLFRCLFAVWQTVKLRGIASLEVRQDKGAAHQGSRRQDANQRGSRQVEMYSYISTCHLENISSEIFSK